MPEMKLADDYVLRFEAIDPDTEAAITGVTVSKSVLFGDGDTSEKALPLGSYLLVPGPRAA